MPRIGPGKKRSGKRMLYREGGTKAELAMFRALPKATRKSLVKSQRLFGVRSGDPNPQSFRRLVARIALARGVQPRSPVYSKQDPTRRRAPAPSGGQGGLRRTMAKVRARHGGALTKKQIGTRARGIVSRRRQPVSGRGDT